MPYKPPKDEKEKQDWADIKKRKLMSDNVIQIRSKQSHKKVSMSSSYRKIDKKGEKFNEVKKEYIRGRDGYICQECSTKAADLDKRLQCHHINVEEVNHSPFNLIALCESCHIIVHKTEGTKEWEVYEKKFKNIVIEKEKKINVIEQSLEEWRSKNKIEEEADPSIEGKRVPGRPKGSSNKLTGKFKESLAYIFDQLGGAEGLLNWIKKHKEEKTFYDWVMTKLVPKEIVADIDVNAPAKIIVISNVPRPELLEGDIIEGVKKELETEPEVIEVVEDVVEQIILEVAEDDDV